MATTSMKHIKQANKMYDVMRKTMSVKWGKKCKKKKNNEMWEKKYE